MKDDFNFAIALRVRWNECDPQGVVFFGNYLTYFDIAMTAYMEAVELPMEDFDKFFTVRAEVDYRKSARFNDEIECAARCLRIGRTSMTMRYELFRGEEILAEGAITYVYADPQTQDKAPIPETLKKTVAAFEKTPPEGL